MKNMQNVSTKSVISLSAFKNIRNIITGIGALTALCLFPNQAHAILTNGSFETGDFTGWSVNDLTSPFYALQVNTAGQTPGFSFFTSAPTDGNFAALHGFDGNGPGTISIAQDITVPNSGTVVEFDWRVGYDMGIGATATQDRLFNVNINQTAGGTNLASFNIFTTDIASNLTVTDSGSQTSSVDLTAFAGQDVQLSFDAFIPENFTGPGFFQLDNVQATSTSVPFEFSPTLGILAVGSIFGISHLRKKSAAYKLDK